MATSKRSHISTACETCRRRKVRCDGVRPICGFCLDKRTGCDYAQVLDGRRDNSLKKRVTRLTAEVERLRARVLELESGASGGGISDSTDSSGASMQEKAPCASDNLYYDFEDGSLSFIGPTSVPSARSLQGSGSAPSGDGCFKFRQMIETPVLAHFDLDKQAHDQLLSLFFAYLNGFTSFVDEDLFRQGMIDRSIDVSVDTPGYSLFLHLVILALATCISPDSLRSSSGQKSNPFVQAALQLVDAEINRRHPTVVIALILLCPIAADMGKMYLSWIFVGIAIRVAQETGIHIDAQKLVESGLISVECQRARDDAFWTVFVQEKLNSLYCGRSPSLAEDDFNLPMPTPSNDVSLPTSSPAKRAFVDLAVICGRIQRVSYGVLRPPLSPASHQALQAQLQAWRSNLPRAVCEPPKCPEPTPAIYGLHCLSHAIAILLSRPLLQRHTLQFNEGQCCLQSALDIGKLVEQYDQRYGIERAVITFTQIIHVPVTFLILLLADLHDQPAFAEEHLQATRSLDSLLAHLEKLSASWKIAGQTFLTLKSMKDEYMIGQMNAKQAEEVSYDVEWNFDFPFDVSELLGDSVHLS